MFVHKQHFNGFQRGVSLTGLIFVLALLGMVVVFAFKVLPSVVEYRAIKDGIKIAKEHGGSARDIQQSFEKTVEINNIESVRGRDLVISKDTGATEISFAYEKRIPLAGNVSLLIDYAGTTDKSGIVPEKKTADAQ